MSNGHRRRAPIKRPKPDGYAAIIDELGFLLLTKTGAEMLFEIISQRYEQGATLITGNLTFGSLITQPVVAR